MNNYTAKANLFRYLSLFSLIVHIVLQWLGAMVFVPQTKAPNLTIAVIFSVPLLLFLPFIIRRHLRAHAWLSFTTLFYFMMVVPSVLDPRYSWVAQAEFGNIIFLFCATMWFVRCEQRRLGISITR